MTAWKPISEADKSVRIIGLVPYGSKWQAHHLWWNDQEEEWNDVTSDRVVRPVLFVNAPDVPKEKA